MLPNEHSPKKDNRTVPKELSQYNDLNKKIQSICNNLSIESSPHNQFKQIISLYRHKNIHPVLLSNEITQSSLFELLQYYHSKYKEESPMQRNYEKIRLGTIRLISWIGTRQDTSIFKLVITHPSFLTCFIESLSIDPLSYSEEQLKTLNEMLDFIKFGCDHSISFSEMLPYTDILTIIHGSLCPIVNYLFHPISKDQQMGVKRKIKKQDVHEKLLVKLLYLYHQILINSSSFPVDVSKIELHFPFFTKCLNDINVSVEINQNNLHQIVNIILDIMLLYVKYEKIRSKALDFFGNPDNIRTYLFLFPKISGQEKRLVKLIDICMTYHISCNIDDKKFTYKSLDASIELIKPLLDHILSLLDKWITSISANEFESEAIHSIKLLSSQETRVLSYILIHGIEGNLTEEFVKRLRIDRLFSSSFIPLLTQTTFTFSMLNILFLCCISSSQILYWLIQSQSLDVAFHAFSITNSTKCLDMALNIINTMTLHSDFMTKMLSHHIFYPKMIYLFVESINCIHSDYVPRNRSLWITIKDYELYLDNIKKEHGESELFKLLSTRFYTRPFCSMTRNSESDSDSNEEENNDQSSSTIVYISILNCFKNWSGRRQFSHSMVLDTFHGKILAYFGSLWYHDVQNRSTIETFIKRILLYLPNRSDLIHTDVYNLLYFLVYPLISEFTHISGISGSQELFSDEKHILDCFCDFPSWKKRLEEDKSIDDIRLIFLSSSTDGSKLDSKSSFNRLVKEWKKIKNQKNDDEIQNKILESACEDVLSFICLLGICTSSWREQVIPLEFDQSKYQTINVDDNSNVNIQICAHIPATILIHFPDKSDVGLPGENLYKQSIFFRNYIKYVKWSKNSDNNVGLFPIGLDDINNMINISSLTMAKLIFETISKALFYDPESHAFLKCLETSHNNTTSLNVLIYYLQLFTIINKYMFIRWEDKILYLIWRIFMNLDLKKLSDDDLKMLLDVAFGADSVIFCVVRPYLPRWMKKMGWLICCRFPNYALEHFDNEALFLCFE